MADGNFQNKLADAVIAVMIVMLTMFAIIFLVDRFLRTDDKQGSPPSSWKR